MSVARRDVAARRTVLAMGAWHRLALAGVLIGALWLAVGWALDWFA